MYKHNYNEITKADNYFSFSVWLVPVGIALLLITISFFNFLLFHTLAEFFAITIAILTCVVAWNMYPFTRNNYLMYLGAGYFWIGVLDLLHTLSYENMYVLPYGGANMGTQFWIGTRYLEALLLLSAPWFLTHSLKRITYFIAYGFAAAVIMLLIWAGLFPESFIPGKGLTPFKVYSEYLIIALLGLSIFYLYKRKEFLEKKIINVLILAIIFTMGAELAFTYYVSVFGISNLIGHILKIFSFWLIFLAIIRTTLEKPFLALSQGASTYDAVPDATIVVDKDGIIRQANIAASRLSGQQKEKLIGKNHHEIFHSDKFTSANCPVCQAILKRDEFIGYEQEVGDGEKWYDFSISYMAGAEQYAGAVEVIRDVTKRKNTENTLSKVDILKKSIIENLPLTLFVKDAENLRYVEWNKAAEELTGVPKEEMIGHSDFDFWPQEEAQEFVAADSDVIRKKMLLDIPEETITTRHKGIRTLHTKKIPIYDVDGKARYLLGIAEDITDKKQTERMLVRSQKMEAVGQMSGGIAHDFNNQLGVILGYTDLLSDKIIDEKQTAWLGAIKIAADRCADLTKQLLIFSRSGVIDKEVVNLNNLIENIDKIIQRTLTPEVNVEYFLNENLWETELNAGAFQDSIINLILNARDAMPDGGSIVIETSNFTLQQNNSAGLPDLKHGDYVQVLLSDTGAGMSPEVAEHVFEPFYTTKEVGKGTGLGLAMVYGFISRCGGNILLDSQVGKGTTFRIYLPRAATEEKVLLHNQISDSEFPQGNETILVVDDEINLVTLATHNLESWGYKVYSANNAADAITILENNTIDMLFTDVIMPGSLNGYALAEKAKILKPDIKVLITSGFTDKFGNNKEYEKYNFHLISKPSIRKNLAEKIRSIFDE